MKSNHFQLSFDCEHKSHAKSSFREMRFFTFVFVFLAILGFASAEKLKIGIFIEAECRYSKQFISNQFRPAYNGIKDQVDIEFFTFGKSESFVNAEGQTEFTCQHGNYNLYFCFSLTEKYPGA
jgi:Gamma interferon inducible lysosomal thiol reductase (GILT)